MGEQPAQGQDVIMAPAESVVLGLNIHYPTPEMEYPSRRIRLDQDVTSVEVGRASRKRDDRIPALANGYFDSPVMSRSHALFEADFDNKAVYVADTGSMHGTYVNGCRLPTAIDTLCRHKLANGDTIRFGIAIMQNKVWHQAPIVEVDFHFQTATDASANSNGSPNVFQVPDEWADDDSSSESDIAETMDLNELRARHGIICTGPLPPSIDLTGDDPFVQEVEAAPVHDSAPRAAADTTVSQSIVIDLTGGSEVPSMPVSPMHQTVAPHEPANMPEVRHAPSEQPAHTQTMAVDPEIDPTTGSSWSMAFMSDEEPESRLSLMTEVQPEDEEEIHLTDTDASEDELLESDDESLSEDHSPSERSLDDEPLEDYPNSPVSERSFNGRDLIVEYEEYSDEDAPADQDDDEINNDWDGSPSPAPIEQEEATLEEARYSPIDRQSIPIVRPNAQLPSISSVFTDPRIHLAEHLGKVSGKAEYFSAREENRASLATSCHLPPIQLAPLSPQKTVQMAPVASPREPPIKDAMFAPASRPAIAQGTGETSLHPVVSTSSQAQDKSAPTPTPTPLLVTSAWTLAGEQFLNSPPPQELAAESDPPNVPELDMTSAYQFSLSKNNLAGRARVDIRDIVDTEPKSNVLKRKADDISMLTPEEESESFDQAEETIPPAVAEDSIDELFESEPLPTTETDESDESAAEPTSPTAPIMPRADGASETRAPKRLRRMAEALGYVALGSAATGVALFSALVATAPVL